MIGFAALLFCLSEPRFKRFALAVLVSPLAASMVFLIGLFVLADMNPAAEYGAEYIPTGKEHDPTALDNALWLGSTAATFLFCGFACIKVQKFWGALGKLFDGVGMICGVARPGPKSSTVRCRDRLGGLLKFYSRAA